MSRVVALLVVFALSLLIGVFSWVTPLEWWRDAALVVGIMFFSFIITVEGPYA